MLFLVVIIFQDRCLQFFYLHMKRRTLYPSSLTSLMDSPRVKIIVLPDLLESFLLEAHTSAVPEFDHGPEVHPDKLQLCVRHRLPRGV